MLAIILLTVGILSRFAVHLPNFTPVIAVALMGGVYLPKRLAIVLSLILLLITDLVIGFHNTMIFTWGSVILIAAIGFWLREKRTLPTILTASLLSSILFFVITNFGVWLVGGLYEFTWQGLTLCFELAIPFFKNEVASSILYSLLFHWGYEFAAVRLKNTRFAHVL